MVPKVIGVILLIISSVLAAEKTVGFKNIGSYCKFHIFSEI